MMIEWFFKTFFFFFTIYSKRTGQIGTVGKNGGFHAGRQSALVDYTESNERQY